MHVISWCKSTPWKVHKTSCSWGSSFLSSFLHCFQPFQLSIYDMPLSLVSRAKAGNEVLRKMIRLFDGVVWWSSAVPSKYKLKASRFAIVAHNTINGKFSRHLCVFIWSFDKFVIIVNVKTSVAVRNFSVHEVVYRVFRLYDLSLWVLSGCILSLSALLRYVLFRAWRPRGVFPFSFLCCVLPFYVLRCVLLHCILSLCYLFVIFLIVVYYFHF